MPSPLSIGAVARAAGVSVDTVRFYEHRGVLPRPARRASGYRAYEPSIIDRLRFAKRLQALGFTLEEVVGLLGDVDRGSATCAKERPRFTTVLQRVDAKIATLVALRRDLRTTLRRCETGRCALSPGASGR